MKRHAVSKLLLRTIPAVLLLLAGAAFAQADVVYDLAADYSTTQSSNVNGVWSYGWQYASLGPAGFTPATYLAPLANLVDSPDIGWCGADGATSGWTDPQVNVNTSSTVYEAAGCTWQPGEVAIGGDPTSVCQPDIRFTAPEDGVYNLDLTYTSIQNNWPPTVRLLFKNFAADPGQAPLVSWYGEGKGSSTHYTNSFTLSAGEYLDFMEHGPEMTGVAITITQVVPEPGMGVLLAMAAVGAAAWWKRRG